MKITHHDHRIAASSSAPASVGSVDSIVWATIVRCGTLVRVAWHPIDRLSGRLTLTFGCDDLRFLAGTRAHMAKMQIARETGSITWRLPDPVGCFAWSVKSVAGMFVHPNDHRFAIILLTEFYGAIELKGGVETAFPIPLEVHTQGREKPYCFGG